MDADMRQNKEKLFADYVWLSKELLKFLQQNEIEMFLSLVEQRQTILDNFDSCKQEWRPSAEQITEISQLDEKLQDNLQIYLNKERTSGQTIRAYQSLDIGVSRRSFEHSV